MLRTCVAPTVLRISRATVPRPFGLGYDVSRLRRFGHKAATHEDGEAHKRFPTRLSLSRQQNVLSLKGKFLCRRYTLLSLKGIPVSLLHSSSPNTECFTHQMLNASLTKVVQRDLGAAPLTMRRLCGRGREDGLRKSDLRLK
jgi:hypothetical protein